MSQTIVVKRCGIGNFEWLQFDNNHSEVAVGDSELLAEKIVSASKTIALLPADWVGLRKVNFEEHERKVLKQTVPFAIEDDLIDDVDDLHFALGEPGDSEVPLAIIRREQMQQVLQDLPIEEADIHTLVSEIEVIPCRENSWSILVESNRWLVRYGDDTGFAIEPDNASLALQLLLDESDSLPEALDIYGLIDLDQADKDHVLALLPELLRGIVIFSEKDYWSMVAINLSQQQKSSVNLLQGEFARSLPWKKWWSHWRLVLILFGAAVLVQFISGYIQLSSLQTDNLELRRQIETTYRSAIPRGAIVDAEKQLSRQVNAMKGQSSGGFVDLLEAIALAINTVDGVNLQSMNYTEKQSEIRMTILANTFEDVETLRIKIEQSGLKAELTGSNAEGGKTRARLKVRG